MLEVEPTGQQKWQKQQWTHHFKSIH